MARIFCLGVGLVGSYVAKLLTLAGYEVHAFDPNPHRIANIPGIRIHKLNQNENPVEVLSQLMNSDNYTAFDTDRDIVVNMLPGDIAHQSTSSLAKLPWKTVDLSFSALTPDNFHKAALKSGSSIIWDTGIAPGLSNMLLSEAHRKLGPLKIGEVRVGGNPAQPTGEWNYMAPFSPLDVIAEYTRPARVIRDSQIVLLPPLSDRHYIRVPKKGDMEAFLTDGLRSVLHSIPSVNMSEYTLRWPGHIQKYINERDSGSIDINSLTKEWEYDDQTPEFTWMEVMAEGMDGTRMTWTVEDHGGEDGHSMARCTGLVTVCCVEEWIADPKFIPIGIHPPEILSTEAISRILNRMTEYGVVIDGPNFTP